jgi:hypothetical protein
MRTENEIINATLEERQKMYVELKQVPTNDKYYATAKALIELIENTAKWKEPKQGEVVAVENLIVDGRPVNKGDTIKVYEWQFKALQRYLKDPNAEEPKEEKPKQQQLQQPPAGSTPAGRALVARPLRKLFRCCCSHSSSAFGLNADAQVQLNATGSQGNYHAYYIAGLNGTTNQVGTNSFITGVTNFTYITNANWTLVNGSATNISTITTNQTVNVPGLISVVNNDLINISWYFNLNGAGSSTATLTADYSDDLVFWRSNALSLSLVANGTAQVSTNVTLSLFGPGFIRFNTIAYPSPTALQTNVLSVQAKASRTGPF